MSFEGVAAIRMIPAAPRNLWATAWWRYARNPVRVLAAAAALVIVAASVLAPLLAPTRYAVSVIAESLQQPSVRHWLGTDAIGRDVVSRLLYGGRTSLEVALAVVALAVLVGVPLGVAAGFAGGWVDYAVLRLVEISTALPAPLLAMLPISVLGRGAAGRPWRFPPGARRRRDRKSTRLKSSHPSTPYAVLCLQTKNR